MFKVVNWTLVDHVLSATSDDGRQRELNTLAIELILAGNVYEHESLGELAKVVGYAVTFTLNSGKELQYLFPDREQAAKMRLAVVALLGR